MIKYITASLLWMVPTTGQITISAFLKKMADRNTCSCNKESLKIEGHDRYERHLKAAKTWPGAKAVDEKTLEHEIKRGKLVRFGPSKSRKISHLTHSHDLLHNGPAEVFEELSQRFHNEILGTKEADAKIVISSLCRTKEQQKSLAKKNSAATRGISSHSYGASIDIKSVETSGNCKFAIKKLEKVVRQMRKEGKILVIREGACIHLTAKN